VKYDIKMEKDQHRRNCDKISLKFHLKHIISQYFRQNI